MEKEEYKIEYFNKLHELYNLYDSVKKSIILAENFDETREMYVAPINELRSALDHIFKSIFIAQETDKSDYELKEAKEHMERAGYDALELLAGSICSASIEKLIPYDRDILTTIFPQYYTEIRPKITETRISVANRRMERKTNSDESFFAYFDEIRDLINISKEIEKIIPSLQECQDKKRKEKRIERWWKILIPIITAIISFLLALFVKK